MTDLNNGDVARALDQIGDILEIKGENRFRIIGYRRGAEALRNLGRDVREVWRAGELRTVPGIGEALAEKIDELLRTGRLGYLERLEAEIPAGVVSLLRIPDIGPSKARAMWDSLGIAGIDDAEKAARDGKLRDLPGFGAKTEAKILAGIETLRRRGETTRRPLGDVLPIARSLLAALRDAAPGIVQAEVGGSVRRWRDTIGDVDLLAASTGAEEVMAAFRGLPQVSAVLGTGPTKTSVRLHNDLQVDLRVVPPERWGTALQYFTGSQAHNVELRELALKQGWSLNEYALTSTKTGEERTFADEESLYAALGLDMMAPELREGRGEIAATRAHRLPRLVTLADILGELHAHSTWSDGKNSVDQMAAAAVARGYRYFALTDHSQSLGITGGMNEEAWRAQHVEIEAARARVPGTAVAPRRRGGGAPGRRPRLPGRACSRRWTWWSRRFTSATANRSSRSPPARWAR